MKTQSNQSFYKLSAAFSIVFMALIAGLAMGLFYPTILKNVSIIQREIFIPLWLFTSCFVLIAILDLWLSYAFLKIFPFQGQNKISSVLRLIYSLILLFSLRELIVLSFKSEIDTNQLNETLRFFNQYWSLALIVFGLHLVFLSKVLCDNQFGPRFLSLLLLIAGCCYSVHHTLNSFVDGYAVHKVQIDAIIALPCALAELLLAFYLWKLRSTADFSSDSTQ